MKDKNIKKQPTWGGHVSVASYSLGYVFSLILTLLAFFLVWTKSLSPSFLSASLIFLALVQMAVQLRFFFNFGKEEKPRWNFWAFFFMALLLLIVFIGTLVIMSNLDYRMMEP